LYTYWRRFQISPHLTCEEIWNHPTCGEISDFSTSVMYRNLTFLHMTDFFSTGTARGARDKYQVWVHPQYTEVHPQYTKDEKGTDAGDTSVPFSILTELIIKLCQLTMVKIVQLRIPRPKLYSHPSRSVFQIWSYLAQISQFISWKLTTNCAESVAFSKSGVYWDAG
jgi:hypothetical protein